MDKPRTPSKPSRIVRLNLQRYERLLAAETDPVRRETIAKVLVELETKLRALEEREGRKP